MSDDRTPSLAEAEALAALLALARDPEVKVKDRISAAQQVLLSEWRMNSGDEVVWVDTDDD